ncbi:ScbA/BarX family gamma-butyrolactone biosynthesis protein [Nocardiopsis sp. N85]|uniref:ScbA/BarX family gamma-butyrolactone biosynthesis protein n=1 Tax=Nocardiopsis sp. N85 TaxID=3029400 RepID=UPI00237F0033|nr:ScbA/BarX family gamma-butyrolactone biosynthesis protein [Nocardiopsis sp. N85]MDE3723842.1 ScbA/BarX family gamma-butyrolactone biosynthesis protein [Nocardiopsis sp. N85]
MNRTTADAPSAVAEVTDSAQRALADLDPENTGIRELDYDATVPRGLVHRKAVSEVFVTDSRQTGENTFDVAAQLPRGHVMLETPTYDLPLILEACRQTGVLISHRHLDVPMDRAFIMHRMSLHIGDLDGLRQGAEPARLMVATEADLYRNQAGRLRGYDFRGTVLLNGTEVAQATGALIFLSRQAYQALRTKGRESLDWSAAAAPRAIPAQPSVVGRRDPRNVVITDPVQRGDESWRATVVPDHSHPHLFDHPLDHLPGNLLIEAARQVAVAGVARSEGLDPVTLVPVSVEASFSSFCENDLPSTLEADITPFRSDERFGPVVGVDVRVNQQGTTNSSFRIEVAQWV